MHRFQRDPVMPEAVRYLFRYTRYPEPEVKEPKPEAVLKSRASTATP